MPGPAARPLPTYGDLCAALLAELDEISPALVAHLDWSAELDVDRARVDLGPVSVMALARFISGVAGRMEWVVAQAGDCAGAELCAAILAQLRESDPELVAHLDQTRDLDMDRATVDIGAVPVMALARFISGIAGRMEWVAAQSPGTAEAGRR